jgi:hypothetical protein
MFPRKLSSLDRCLAAALAVVALIINAPAQERQPEPIPPPVIIQPASDTDLAFDLMHMEIVADGRLPSQGSDYAYRVVSVGDQGNCVGMCPATVVYVVLGNISANRDEKMKLYRIDGIRFMHFPKVTVLDPDENGGFFLAFRFVSMPHPDVTQHYIARIGPQGAVVERDGPDNPAPAHRLGQFFQRPGGGVFRIKLKDGTIFRLREFEIDSYSGQPDAWVAEVVESGRDNPADYQMKAGTHYGPFLESEIAEIFDEGLGETVFARKE